MEAGVRAWESPKILQQPRFVLNSKREDLDYGGEYFSMEALSLEQFKRRREALERKNMQHHLHLPPNPFLEPKEFVTELLCELRHPRTHKSGVVCLLESSTTKWRKILCQSVGADETTPNEEVALSLERSMKRKDNQFGILLGTEDKDYLLNFPSDLLDFEDGTCWLECRIRSAQEDELLVVQGWDLRQRASDGAWLVNSLDRIKIPRTSDPTSGVEMIDTYFIRVSFTRVKLCKTHCSKVGFESLL